MGRDLLLALGWAVFVGGGIALGLALGSLGADVPADAEMLLAAAVVTGAATLVVRLAMVVWKYRPGQRAAHTATAAAPSREAREVAGDEEREQPQAQRGASRPVRRQPTTSRRSGGGRGARGTRRRPRS